ncbi:MAG: hypothetical protein WBD07_15335, partial [Vicinamibacterales bacterium]
ATRLARFLSASDKSYDATIRLGVATDTGDAEGSPVGPHAKGAWPSRDVLERALDTFRGTHPQQPPAFSAKKIGGTRSYKLARARAAALLTPVAPVAPLAPAPVALAAPVAPLAPAPVLVTAHAIELVSVADDLVTIRLECSAGFYVRALAQELGERLGVGAHLATLRRTRSGGFGLSEAVELDAIEREPALALRTLVPLSRMLSSLEAVTLTLDGVRRALHGQDLGPADTEKGVVPPDPFFVRLLDREGQLLGIAEPSQVPGFLHPAVVLV